MFWCSAATFCVSSFGCTEGGGITWPELSNADHARSRGSECLIIYFSCLGSQSSPGRRSLAVCLTSSLSTSRLLRCSAWTIATLIHSIRGGSKRKGLWKRKKEKWWWFRWRPSVSRFISTPGVGVAHQPLWLILGFATQVSWLSHAERNS